MPTWRDIIEGLDALADLFGIGQLIKLNRNINVANQQPVQPPPVQQQNPAQQPNVQRQPTGNRGPWEEAMFTRTFDLLSHAEQMALSAHIRRYGGPFDLNPKKIRLVIAAIASDAERLVTMQTMANLQPAEFDDQVRARGMLLYDPDTITWQDLQNLANDLVAALPTAVQIRDGWNQNINQPLIDLNNRLLGFRGFDPQPVQPQPAVRNNRWSLAAIISIVFVVAVIIILSFTFVSLATK